MATILPSAGKISTVFSTIFSSLWQTFRGISALSLKLLQAVQFFATGVFSLLSLVLSYLLNFALIVCWLAQSLVSGVFSVIPSLLCTLWIASTSVVTILLQLVHFLLRTAVVLIGTILAAIWVALTNIASITIQSAQFFYNGTVTVVPAVLSSVWGALTAISGNSFYSAQFLVKTAATLITTILSALWLTLTSILKFLLQSIHFVCKGTVTVLPVMFSSAWRTLTKILVFLFQSAQFLLRATGSIISILWTTTLTSILQALFQSAKFLLSENDLPENWSPMPKKNGIEVSVHLVELEECSHEYREVLQKFQNTGGNGCIKNIKRIQNPHLYDLYMVRKRKIDKETRRQNNEKKLFHGTNYKNLEKINENGFNRSFCGVHATLFGKGVYFAGDAGYSMKYSDATNSGYKSMYLARVLVGQYTEMQKGNKDLKEPPFNPQTQRHYDSVSGYNGRIFVVFHDAQCYPEYLITLKILKENGPPASNAVVLKKKKQQQQQQKHIMFQKLNTPC